MIMFVAALVMMCGIVKAGMYEYDFTQTTAEGLELAYIIVDDSTVYVGVPGKVAVTLDTVIVPSTVTYLGVTYTVRGLAAEAFSLSDGIKRVVLPSSLNVIGNSAFSDCYSIDTIVVPDAVTDIKESAFQNCTSLVVLVIGKGVVSMGNQMILGTNSLVKVNYMGKADQWNAISFGTSSSNPIAKLHQLYINDTLLTDLVFDTATTVTAAFKGCWSIQSITFGKSTTNIVNSAFKECKGLTSLYLGDSIVSVGINAFQDCTGLKSVTISSSVKSIGSNAFYRCTGLEEITFKGTNPPDFGSNAFQQVPDSVLIYVPCGTFDSYKAKLPSTFINIIDDMPIYSIMSNDESRGTVEVTKEPSCLDLEMVFNAIPAKGYHFSAWSDGNTANPRALGLNKDTALIAYFEPDEYSVIVLSSNADYGSVEGGGTAKYLDTVFLTATPASNCVFVRWEDGDTSNPRSIVVMSDTVLTALFTPVTDGIDEVDRNEVAVTVAGRQVVVIGTDGVRKEIFDVYGRRLYSTKSVRGIYTAPASGVYLLLVGESRTLRIVVL